MRGDDGSSLTDSLLAQPGIVKTGRIDGSSDPGSGIRIAGIETACQNIPPGRAIQGPGVEMGKAVVTGKTP